jgi:polyisoprenoid-binding protein YceI
MTTYRIDPLHSFIEFKIKHLMISTVNGSFQSFDATLNSDGDDFANATVTFSADVNSISTNIIDRDNHLKSADFFDAENYPKINFNSTSVEKADGNSYVMNGDLEIRGISRPISLSVEYNGEDEDAYGQTKVGFDMEGKINRKDWGLDFNVAGGKGSLLVGDEVKLNISIQMIKQ